jgi:hypothetical protein
MHKARLSLSQQMKVNGMVALLLAIQILPMRQEALFDARVERAKRAERAKQAKRAAQIHQTFSFAKHLSWIPHQKKPRQSNHENVRDSHYFR